MPVVTIEMWEGRTIEEKKQLMQGITSTFVELCRNGRTSRSSAYYH